MTWTPVSVIPVRTAASALTFLATRLESNFSASAPSVSFISQNTDKGPNLFLPTQRHWSVSVLEEKIRPRSMVQLQERGFPMVDIAECAEWEKPSGWHLPLTETFMEQDMTYLHLMTQLCSRTVCLEYHFWGDNHVRFWYWVRPPPVDTTATGKEPDQWPICLEVLNSHVLCETQTQIGSCELCTDCTGSEPLVFYRRIVVILFLCLSLCLSVCLPVCLSSCLQPTVFFDLLFSKDWNKELLAKSPSSQQRAKQYKVWVFDDLPNDKGCTQCALVLDTKTANCFFLSFLARSSVSEVRKTRNGKISFHYSLSLLDQK